MKKDCKFCDKKGLMILPLRYSVALADDMEDLSAIPALPPTLGSGVSDLALTQGKYVARMLREGYLYVLIERQKIKSWESYLVTDDAYLYKFPVDFPPQTKIEFTCAPDTCGIDASMVSIDKASDVEKVYFLFTPSPMTKSKLDEYKKDPDGMVTKKKMQIFNPKAWLAGTTKQPHAMQVDEMQKNTAEAILYNQADQAISSPLGGRLANHLFSPTNSAYSGIDPRKNGGKPASGRLGALYSSMQQRKAASFVIYDHIGITQELNDFRNAAFARIEAFLDRTDKYQVSNQRKLTIYEKIQELRAGFENGMINDAANMVKINDMKRRAKVEPIFPDDTPQMKTFKMQANNAYTHSSRTDWEEENPAIVAEFDAAYEKDAEVIPEQAKAQAKESWAKKYLPKLDATEMKTFIANLDSMIESANKAATTRTADHLKWVTSAQLLNAFDAYDKNNDANGHEFEGQSALCTFGMTSVPTAAEQVEAWIKDIKVGHANIYMRGYYMNQLAVEKAAIEAMPQIEQLAAAAPNLSEMHGPSFLAFTKKLLDSFKKVDSAYDEWVRSHKQKATLGWGETREAAIFAKSSEMTRIVSRAGIGKFDKSMGALIGAMTYARIGDIATKIGPEEFFLKIKKDHPERLKGGYKGNTKAENTRYAQRAARFATKNAVAQMENGMLELIYDARKKVQEKANLTHAQVLEAHQKIDAGQKVDLKTNNYHQARIGVALAVLESIALYNKLSDFKANGRAWTELAGSALSLSSITCDIVYSSVKSMREVSLAKAVGVDTAADIVRGGWKATAGVLGTFAGVASFFMDGMNLKDEIYGKQRGFLMALYAARGYITGRATYFGAVATFSYAGPMLEYAAKRANNAMKLEAAARLARKFAEKRVFLLLNVARFNALGLAITGTEIAYYGYVKFIADNALQKWCLQSTFRRQKTETTLFGVKKEKDRYVTEAEELKALEAATTEVLED